MANNSDGSIVLSVKIDTDNLKSQTKKLNDEILKAVKSESKIAVETEKANQALLKTQILQEKLNALKEKTRSETEKANVSESKAAEAVQKVVAAEQRVQTEKAKTAAETSKAETAEINKARAVVQTVTAIQKQNTEAEKTLQAMEKTTQEQEKTRQAFEKTFQEQEKSKQSVEKTAQSIEKTKQAQEKTTQETIKTKLAQEKLKDAATKVAATMKQVATQLGIIFGVREILRFSNEASQLAAQQEANLKRLSMLYGEHTKQVYDFANANANAMGMAKSAAYQAAADYGNLFRTFSNGAESAKLTNEMLQATAVIASQTGRTYEDVFEKIRSGLYGNTRAIDDLGITVRNAGLKQTEAFKTVTGGVKKWNDLTDAELQNVRALGIIEQTYKLYGNTVIQSASLTRSQFNAAWTDFKANWGTVINGVLIPAMNVLTKIINLLSVGMQAIAKLMGKSVEMKTVSSNISAGSSQMADDIGTASDNQKKLTKGVKDTNKELKKTLAGFDELQILQSNDGSGGGSGAGSGSGGGGGVSAEVPTVSGGGEFFESNVDPIKSSIAGLAAVLVGSGLIALGVILLMGKPPSITLGLTCILAGLTSIGIGLVMLGAAFDSAEAKDAVMIFEEVSGLLLLCLGVILLFFGQFGWGLTAIIGGLTLLGHAAYQASKTSFDDLKAEIASLLAVVGGALLAIGAILCWLQMWGWGIAAIIAGLTLMGYSAYMTLQDDGSDVETWVNRILQIAGGALAGIGVILCMLGSYAWGVALIIAGIAIFAVSAINSSGDISSDVKNWVNGITAIVSAAALVIGIVLLCCGVITPLSIGLVAAGAIVLASEVVLNWNAIKESVTQFLADNQALIVGVSLALLVLGIILCCTGVALPLGIGLIAAGAIGLASEAVLNWEEVTQKIKDVFNTIKTWLTIAAKLVIGVVLCFSGVGLPLGLALIIDGVSEIKKGADIDWEAVGDKIEEVLDDIKEWIETYGSLALGIILCLTGVGIPFGLKMIVDWCEDNYEKNEIATAIVDKVKDIWDKIKTFWDDNIAKIFTKDWWLELAKKCGNGLLKGFESAANGIIGIFEKMINYVVEQFNKLKIDIPDWVPKVGGKKFGFNLSEVKLKRVSIPPLAKGAVLPANKPFLAVVGDQKSGTNVEAPLSVIEQAVRNVLSDSSYSNNSGDQTIILQLDGREVGRTFGNAIRKENNRTGNSFIKTKLVFG